MTFPKYPDERKAVAVGSHIIVKLSIVILIALLTFYNTLVGQSRILQGRILSNDLETLSGVQIQNIDKIILGETDLEGKFKIKLPQKTQILLLSGIGLEPTTIILNDNCDTIEVVMILAGTYDFMSSKKIDKFRLKIFKQLPELYFQAYNRGLFRKSTVCYSRQFEPEKPILDSIRKEIIKQQQQNKITFDSLKIGDTVKIPFSGEYRYDGTDRTTLFVRFKFCVQI